MFNNFFIITDMIIYAETTLISYIEYLINSVLHNKKKILYRTISCVVPAHITHAFPTAPSNCPCMCMQYCLNKVAIVVNQVRVYVPGHLYILPLNDLHHYYIK